jgi:hypothetical protein
MHGQLYEERVSQKLGLKNTHKIGRWSKGKSSKDTKKITKERDHKANKKSECC